MHVQIKMKNLLNIQLNMAHNDINKATKVQIKYFKYKKKIIAIIINIYIYILKERKNRVKV